jgi:hypothetical protein
VSDDAVAVNRDERRNPKSIVAKAIDEIGLIRSRKSLDQGIADGLDVARTLDVNLEHGAWYQLNGPSTRFARSGQARALK